MVRTGRGVLAVDFHWSFAGFRVVNTKMTADSLLPTFRSRWAGRLSAPVRRSRRHLPVAIGSDPAAPEDITHFIYDGERGERGNAGDHLVLVFDGHGDLTNRYLHGPAVDQILADEQVDSLAAPGEVLWPLTDNLGTVRDLAVYDDATGITAIVNHLTYNAFGEITDQTAPTVNHRFAFTGREWDEDAGLYYYRARWYDPELGRFLSEDPIGFRAGDANLQRYVENAPTTRTDPSGLEEEEGVPDRAYFLYRPSRPIGFQGIGGLANQMGRLEIDRANRVLDAMRDALENAIRDLTREQQAQARAELERLISVAVTTPFSFQLDSCYQWTWDFDGRFRAPATDAFKVRIAIWKYPVWSPIFGNLSHAAIQVTLSDGAQFYLDNGWWGHAFTCHHIPWYVWRHTKGDP